MLQAEVSSNRNAPEPLPDNIRSVQPGGGVCYRIELAWGNVRRWYLRRFRSSYVARMAERMQGDRQGAPHAIIDPRDLKYCRNRCTARWNPPDDPFQWRDQLPIARWGLAEVLLMGVPLVAVMVLTALTPWPIRIVAVVPAVLLGLVLFFFRDPRRQVPDQPGLVVAPADGKVVELTRLEEEPFVGGPAVRIGIFLSIFNVHLNRAPIDARVVRLDYHPGEFLNAINPASALRNEAMKIGLEEVESPHRRMIVRQISGLIARRIVCALRPGEVVRRGAVFGMIKLGSRTELVLPAIRLSVDVSLGQKVQAGATVLAHYERDEDDAASQPGNG